MRRSVFAVVLAAVVVGVVAGGVSALLASGPRGPWVITDLGTLGGSESTAADINERGQVVGWSGGRAFLWGKGRMRDLGTLGGFESEAVAVTDGGVVAGSISDGAGIAPDYQAVVWQSGKLRKLPTLGGTNSWVSAVNERGQIVGVSSVKDGPIHAVVWQKGTVTDLGVGPVGVDTPDGAMEGGPTDINERGQVVGWKPIVRRTTSGRGQRLSCPVQPP